MSKSDWSLKAILLLAALFLGLIAAHSIFSPGVTAQAQAARFDHVYIAATTYLYKGQPGLLVMDRRNANIWFIPRANDQFQDPVFLTRVPFEKLDQLPR